MKIILLNNYVRIESLTKKYLIILNYNCEGLIFYFSIHFTNFYLNLHENMNITLIRLNLIIQFFVIAN